MTKLKNELSKRNAKSMKLLIFFLLHLVSYACMPIDFNGKLPNNYSLSETSNIQIAVLSPNKLTIFQENIAEINVDEHVVFGKIDVLPPDLQRLIEKEAHPGYFVLNTKTGLFQLGLSKQEWLALLSEEGISVEPKLISPSIFSTQSWFVN